jgi:hypothetical protein
MSLCASRLAPKDQRNPRRRACRSCRYGSPARCTPARSHDGLADIHNVLEVATGRKFRASRVAGYCDQRHDRLQISRKGWVRTNATRQQSIYQVRAAFRRVLFSRAARHRLASAHLKSRGRNSHCLAAYSFAAIAECPEIGRLTAARAAISIKNCKSHHHPPNRLVPRCWLRCTTTLVREVA